MGTASRQAASPSGAKAPRISAVGYAVPPRRYSQSEIVERFSIDDAKIRALFSKSHIEGRHLYMPPSVDGQPSDDLDELIARHKYGMLDMGRRAVEACLTEGGLRPADVDLFVTVSSTGFLCPGISAHLTKAMGFREDVRRLDILGMGCNAGMNGLQPATDFVRAHPGKKALVLCCEVCSAAYLHDGTMRTAVVNSLFGDGSAAALMTDDDAAYPDRPRLLDFESHIIVGAIDAMRFDQEQGRLSFYLDREIPYAIGANIRKPVERLLARAGLKKREIAHWVVHSGGKKVIDSIKYNIGLSNHDLRHTRSVLRDFGNVSSGSFLFSLSRLFEEARPVAGDFGVLVAMGPGTSIETGLVQW